jgi:hypothetical protein
MLSVLVGEESPHDGLRFVRWMEEKECLVPRDGDYNTTNCEVIGSLECLALEVGWWLGFATHGDRGWDKIGSTQRIIEISCWRKKYHCHTFMMVFTIANCLFDIKGGNRNKLFLVINKTSADERPSLIAILVKGKKILF